MNEQKTSPVGNFFRRIEDFLIPPLCIICDGALEEDRWLCARCLKSLIANHNSRNACPRCSQNRKKRECACEFAWDFPFEKIFSAYDYDETLSAIAHHIKYKGKRQLAYHIGFITAALVPREFIADINMFIPVPLHKTRLRRRGYNQAEYLARGLLTGLGLDLEMLRTDLLARKRNTVTQTQLDRENRLENLSGAFAVAEETDDLRGKRVILVDDILTTGATTEACTDELLRAGCAGVRVLSMGRD